MSQQLKTINNRGCGSIRGQLVGHNLQNNNNHTPKKLEALAEVETVDMACGEYHKFAGTYTGSIGTWG